MIDAPVTPKGKSINLIDNETKRIDKYDYSAIFHIKEEFIFVFGGKNHKGVTGSVEVFDVQREIWRQFSDSGTGSRRKSFCAISFFNGGLKQSENNNEEQ